MTTRCGAERIFARFGTDYAKRGRPVMQEPNVLELAVGNIGGVWIARNEISDEDKKRVAKINDRWLGAQYDHFRSCSLNADLLHHRPGVVVLAVEPDKAAIVLEALHLINVLIVSRQLADELARRLLPSSAG